MGKNKASFRADVATMALGEAAAAHQSGDVAKARRLYRKVLKVQPRNTKALRLSGLLAQETGQLEEATRLLGAAVRHASTDDTGALEDLALIHLQRSEQEKAEHLLRRALEINPGSLTALVRLGSALITSGQAVEAVDVFGRAREAAPEDPDIGYSHAHALLESSQFEKALTASDETLASHADHAPSLLIKGAALFQLERFAEAEEALTRCASLDTGNANAWLQLGRARAGREDYAGAIEALEKAAGLAADVPVIHSQLANAYTASGQAERALEVCDAYLERHPAASGLLVVKLLALRHAGRTAEADALAGLDKLILKGQITAPPRYGSLAAFNGALEKAVCDHPDLQRTHTNRATRHGVQTGSLTFNPAPEIKDFFGVVDAEVSRVKARLQEAGAADHPWIRHAPRRWKVNAWAVVLRDGGHQLSHVHPEAWLSGCYYVALPDTGMGASHGEDGWIEFGRPSAQLFSKVDSPVVAVEPKPGRMVMFPSYTFHRTIPFRGEGQRICIAFDVFAA